MCPFIRKSRPCWRSFSSSSEVFLSYFGVDMVLKGLFRWTSRHEKGADELRMMGEIDELQLFHNDSGFRGMGDWTQCKRRLRKVRRMYLQALSGGVGSRLEASRHRCGWPAFVTLLTWAHVGFNGHVYIYIYYIYTAVYRTASCLVFACFHCHLYTLSISILDLIELYWISSWPLCRHRKQNGKLSLHLTFV